jgi:hypothetical protein
MDTSWEKVRQKLPIFVALAREYNAASVTPLSQANLLKAINPNSHGLCYGMAIAYLVEVFSQGGSGVNFVANAHLAAAEAARPHEVRRIGDWTGKVNDLQSHWPSEYQTVDDLKRVGLNTKVAWDVTFDQTFYRFTKVADYIIGCASGSAIIIKSPNHAMAAHRKGGRFAFFDPNFGEVVFTAAGDFRSFFVKWFDRDFIQKAYKGSEGGGRNAPPAKSLVLELCVFQ